MLVNYQGPKPETVEGFPDDAKRSCVGALHLLPRRPKEITADEWAWIKANRKDVAAHLVKLSE